MAMSTVPVKSRMVVAGANSRRALLTSCGVHALHDGYADVLYVLLPLWQLEFGLGYAAIGALRAVYVGLMAALQIPVTLVAQRTGNILILSIGTALAAIGYLMAGASTGFMLLVLALAIGGIGSSTQHPIGSTVVAHAYEGFQSRTAIGTYNFAGDLGKMALPLTTAWLVSRMPWRTAVSILGLVGIVVAVGIPFLLSGIAARGATEPTNAVETTSHAIDTSGKHVQGGSTNSFALLFAIGVLDTATRMGFLTYLPFLLRDKGAAMSTVGLALSIVFAGGAVGKLVCGFLGARLGMLATVLLTESLTAVGIIALLPLRLHAGMALLALIGVALNGTSSVPYGTVPELVSAEHRQHAFGIFYTGTVGAGAISPAIYGLFGDRLGVPATMVLVAGVVLFTLPLAWLLNPALRRPQQDNRATV
jgi:FSR family fosmidomycin resistance protein-like MFS transporter